MGLLLGVTSGVGTGSLALGAAGSASGRLRSTIECVLVRQIMQQLHAELQNQQLYNSFVNVEMPSVLVLARMELNGMGGSVSSRNNNSNNNQALFAISCQIEMCSGDLVILCLYIIK